MAWFTSLSINGFAYLVVYGLALLVPSMFLNYFNAIGGVLAPELTGYTSAFISTTRVIMAYIFVVYLRLGLIGALLTVIIARLLGVIFLVSLLISKRLIKWDGFNKKLVVSWVKRFYVPLMNVLTSQLRNFDRVIIALITGSSIPSAYLNASYTARTPLSEGGKVVTLSLRARLLRSPREEDVSEMIRFFCLFTGFTAVTLIALSRPILSLLNPEYIDVYPIFIIAALAEIVYNMARILIVTSVATDKHDLELNFNLLSTRIVKTPIVNFVCNLMGLIIASVLISMLQVLRENYILAALTYPMVWFIISVIITLIVYTHAREALHIRMPWREIHSVVISSLSSMLVYIALGSWNIVVASFWRDAPRLLCHILISLIMYVVIMLVLSGWFRWLISTIVKELLRKVRNII